MAYTDNNDGIKVYHTLNPLDEKDRGKLFDTLEYNYRTTRTYRDKHTELIKTYAGTLYQEENRRTDLVPLLLQTAEAYIIALAANLPQINVSTHDKKLRPFANNYKIAMNNLLKEIRADETFQEVLLDSFFGPAFVKIYMADAPRVQMEDDTWMNPGQPYFERVGLHRFVWDMQSPKWSQRGFSADRYRVPMHQLQDDIYDRKVTAKLQPTTKYEGQEDDAPEDIINRQRGGDSDEYTEMIDLTDVWMPNSGKNGLVVTWPCDRKFRCYGKPLAVLDWDGNEDGPHKMFNNGPVPDNTLSTSPAANLKPLHDLANSVMRKLASQARRQKDLNIYAPAGIEDAKRLQTGNDGDWIKAMDPSMINVLKQGGVDPGNAQFFGIINDVYGSAAGNLQAKLGLGAQADTARQEQMIHQKVNTQEAGMKIRWMKFVTDVVTDLGSLLWKDVVKEMPGEFTLPGTDITIDASWSPAHRQGSFMDYNFTVEVYSMAYQDPRAKAAALQQELQMMMPMMQLWQGQGIQLDLKAYLDIKSELLDLPRLKEIFKYDQPVPQESEGASGGGTPRTLPPDTNRTYTRQNVARDKSMEERAGDLGNLVSSEGGAQ